MDVNYSEYLKTRLLHARAQFDTLDEDEESSAILLANINGIRNIMFEILDYSINHFSGYAGISTQVYFPLLKFENLLEDLGSNKRYLDVVNIIGGKIVDYLLGAYTIIFDPKYEKALLLLNSFSKHRNEDIFLDTKMGSKVKYENFGGPKVEEKMTGGYKIGAFDVGIGEMTGCVLGFVCGGTVIIDKMETFEISGKSLVVKQNGKVYRVLIKLYLKHCLDCCEEIIKLWGTFKSVA